MSELSVVDGRGTRPRASLLGAVHLLDCMEKGHPQSIDLLLWAATLPHAPRAAAVV